MAAARDDQAYLDLNFVTDPKSLAARLESLEPSDRRAKMANALTRASRTLSGEAGSKQVVILSDCRRLDLLPGGKGGSLQKQFEALRKHQTDVRVLDYGRPASRNLTIVSIELVDRFAVAKAPFRVVATVRNNGPGNAENVEVAFEVRQGPRKQAAHLPVQVIDLLEPGQAKRVVVEVTCPSAGSAVVSAAVGGDDLPPDNQADLALAVRNVVTVLVVDGNVDPTDPTENESFFFVISLDPLGGASYGVRPEVISSDNLGGAVFEDYDVVALLDVPDFPIHVDAAATQPKAVHPKLKMLEDYVRGGGGLIMFTGPRINLDFYNGPLYDGGRGLSPLRVKPHLGRRGGSTKFFRLAPGSIASHPVTRVFTTSAAEGVEVTSLVRFSTFTPADEVGAGVLEAGTGGVQILARFADSDSFPAIVARRYGKGNVVMVYTTASKRWNDWPADEVGTYAKVVNDTVRHVARSQPEALTARVGETIVHALDEDLLDAKVMLKTPRYPADDLVLLVATREGFRGRITYAKAERAGVYVLEMQMPDETSQQVLFARNVDPAEGDLAPGGREAVETAFDSKDFSYVHRAAAGRQEEARSETRNEYWLLAAMAALAVLAVETFLGRKFGHYA